MRQQTNATESNEVEEVSRAALTEDVRELLELIESVHPDPYVGYDGRVDLHASVERIVRSLPEAATTEEFYRTAAPVVAGLDDVHSLLHPPENDASPDGADRALPLSFRVVGERLYVEAVRDETLADLVGAKLLAVEGISVSTLAARSRAFRASENRYGAVDRVGVMLERYRPLARLLDRADPPAEPTLSVEVCGDERTRSIAPVTDGAETVASLETTLSLPEGPGPRYRFYEGEDVAVFVPGNLSDYRESLEAKHDASADVVRRAASAAYKRQVGGTTPDDLGATIEALPSMAETLETMTEEMAAAGTDTLVVDLRDNPGGDSQFVFYLAYLLDGWDGVAQAAEEVGVAKRRSELHRRRYGETSLGSDANTPGEYEFSGGFDDTTDDTDGVETVRRLVERSDTASALLRRADEDGTYRPDRLIVVVSASTMSSAFAVAAQLNSLGAEVVGVPSGQAPVSFGEHVEETLPNTGLDVRLSGAMYRWVDDPTGDVLEPARELTPSDFERYGRTDDASLRLAFEYAGYGDPGLDD